MFYSQFILAKKGPLGTIWIAAHLERKLRKNQVADTDIGVSVDSILFPDVPIALRLSSHLLLGVVRIYSRKVNYLFDDCSEALLKVKQAFRSTAVDLPPEQSKAPYHSITLPETFDLDDFELPDNEMFQGNYVDHHVSTREQITLQDTMDGVAFPTSQFGLDERFGDGDASQIGLDLDEDLFMDKGEPAGMSENFDNTATDPEASMKQDTSLRGDEHNEVVSDLPSASPINNFSIQAPSTPGLMEEPNFNAHEALISDDHMDDDHNLPELASKEMSGTASSQVEPGNMHSVAFDSNGDCRHLDDLESTKEKSESALFSHEAVEPTSPGNAQPLKFNEHIEAVDNVDCLRSKPNAFTLQEERVSAGDIQLKGYSDHQNEVALTVAEKPLADNGLSTEVDGRHSCDGFGKSDLNGTCLPVSDHRSGDNVPLEDQGDISTLENEGIVEICGPDLQNKGQSLKQPEALDSNGHEKSSLSTTGLQACNSSFNCDGLENVPDASSLLHKDDGHCSLGISGKENVTNVSEISVDFQDLTNPNLKADEMHHEVTCLDSSKLVGSSDQISTGEHLQQESNTRGSDFSAPEKLLSMPNGPASQTGVPLVEWTPGNEVLAEGDDGSGKKFISGKKRSYTESTLTIQSLNSECSVAAQSKQSVEYIPEDDDLLSSILGGKRSTGLKMKPTPPVTDNQPTKRLRVSVHSTTHKRKVLVDDTMVLHGDTIREQLTNTDDIRRVRKKAPCTRLEVCVLQKQSLEEEVFSEAVFTGLSADLRSLRSEAFNLAGIRIVRGDGRKSSNEIITSLVAGDGGRQVEESIFAVDGSILQKELETFDNEVAKQMSQKVETGNRDGRVQPGGEEDHSDASRLEPSFSAFPSDVNLASGTKTDMLYINNTTDGVMFMESDACRLIDQGYDMASTRDNVSTVEDVSASGRGQELVGASEKLDSEKNLDGPCLSERMEGQEVVDASEKHDLEENPYGTCFSERIDAADTAVAATDLANTLPFCEAVTDSVSLEGRTSPKLDKGTEECQVDEARFASAEDYLASDIRQNDGCAMPNNHLAEDMELDSSNSFEADLSSQNIQLDERENLECWEADPKSVIDPTVVPAEPIDRTEHADIWRDAIEHDTDFLNVDDDDVAEDYESDLPNSDEKRILDNSGWSTRTRAVANYLQGLFEKELYRAEKVISLESLLAGKSRKEASRMFFETLVLTTKDYVGAEQAAPFSDIKIKPAGKLMKSDFVSQT